MRPTEAQVEALHARIDALPVWDRRAVPGGKHVLRRLVHAEIDGWISTMPASSDLLVIEAVATSVRGLLPRADEMVSTSPYTCGLCPWGRDGAYHDKPEYDNHMAHVHPDEWASAEASR